MTESRPGSWWRVFRWPPPLGIYLMLVTVVFETKYYLANHMWPSLLEIKYTIWIFAGCAALYRLELG